MDSVAELEVHTYVIEYNPNCRRRYLVRLVALGAGYIDKLPPGETKDALGYGRTLKEAAAKAFRRVDTLRRKFRKRLGI